MGGPSLVTAVLALPGLVRLRRRLRRRGTGIRVSLAPAPRCSPALVSLDAIAGQARQESGGWSNSSPSVVGKLTRADAAFRAATVSARQCTPSAANYACANSCCRWESARNARSTGRVEVAATSAGDDRGRRATAAPPPRARVLILPVRIVRTKQRECEAPHCRQPLMRFGLPTTCSGTVATGTN